MSKRVDIICVGKAKSGSPEQSLFDKYVRRCTFDVRLSELNESKAKDPKTAMREEAKAIEAKLAPQNFVICLDERGKDLSSPDLADMFETCFLDQKQPTFIIGGSFGLDSHLRNSASLTIRFGKVVWPHLLIRGMLAEQIYRVQTILDRHPYHRV